LAAAGYDHYSKLPLGAVVAVGKLADVHLITDEQEPWNENISTQELSFGYFARNRYAWQFKDISRLEIPVPVAGNRRLWEIPVDDLVPILEQLKKAA